MRKRLLIFAVILATSVAIVAVYRVDVPPAVVRLEFLGYTNSDVGPEAIFSVQFPPRFGGCGWKDPKISRKEGATWKNWSATNPAPPKMRFFNGPIKPMVDGVETMAEAFAAFPVETTNEISRIVIQVDENPRRQSRIEQAAHALWALIRMEPQVQATRSYFITNETSIKPGV